MEIKELGRLSIKIGSGATPLGGESVYTEEGVSFIRSQNVYNDGFRYDGLAHIDESAAIALRNVEVKENDNLLNITGDSVARSCIVPRNALPARVNQHVAIVRPDPSILDSGFLHYVLISNNMQNHLLSLAGAGATRKALTKSMIERLDIPYPPISEQRLISEYLGAFDGIIELNRRMNETIETIARTIFKSWFIDFDPVRAKSEGKQPFGMDEKTAALFPSEFEDSELGNIPKAWKVGKLIDVVEIGPERKLSKGTIATYLDMASVPVNKSRPVSWHDREFTSGSKYSNGDVLLARITPCLENGKTAYVDFLDEGQVGWGSTEFIVLRSKADIPPSYAYFLARSENFRNYAIQNMIGSSGRQRVPEPVLKEYEMVIPPLTILQRFGDLTDAFMAIIKANSKHSKTLASIRDILLPKLISGEIRVPMEAD